MVGMRNAACLSGVSAIALLFSGHASAQAPADPPEVVEEVPVTEDEVARFETVVVTARRREESLLDVPVSVSALTSSDLERNVATDLSKIGELTPGVIVANYKGNSGGSIAVRGISSSANQFGFEQAVAVVIDGVPISSGRIATVGMFDLAQVEVMKGPQALFFGKNSPAGVVSLTSAGPTDTVEVRLKSSYEFIGDEATIEGVVSGPISQSLSARLALKYRNLEGWMYNDARPVANPFFAPNQPAGAAQLPGAYDDRIGDEETMGRLTLAYEPSADFDATLTILAGSLKDQGNGLASQNIGPCVGERPRIFGVPDPFGDCRADNRTTNGARPAVIAQSSPRAPDDGRYQGGADLIVASLNANWALGNLNLVSTTGYSEISNYSYSGIDQTTFSQVWVVDDNETKAISQEIRLLSDYSGPLNFMIGAFYQDVDQSVYNEVGAIDVFGFNPATGRYASYEKLDFMDGRTFSVFAQLVFDLTDELEIAGGARYTDEKKNARISNLYGTNSGIGNYDTANVIFPDSLDQTPGVLAARFTDQNVSPEVTLTWRPQRDRTFYAAYKTGFKSGGFGLSTFLQPDSSISDFDFDSEEASGFEVGAKGVYADGRLRLTSTLFAYEFTNLQVNSYDADALRYRVDNAGSLDQRGLDVEATYIVNDWLNLRGAVSYVKNEFRDFTGQCYTYNIPVASSLTAAAPPNCEFLLNSDGTRFLTAAGLPVLQQDFDGRAPARSPELSANAGFAAELPSVGRTRLELTGDAFYTGDYYASETMAPSTLQDAFWRFNAGLTLSEESDRWRVSLIGRNLSEEYYLTYAADRTGGSSIPLAVGEQRGVVARGREVLLQAAVRF